MEAAAAKLIGAGLAAVGRNPAAASEVTQMTWIGFALVEAIALYALVIAFLILFVF